MQYIFLKKIRHENCRFVFIKAHPNLIHMLNAKLNCEVGIKIRQEYDYLFLIRN